MPIDRSGTRVLKSSEDSVIASLYTAILTIPRSKFTDASVAVQGEDELWRVIAAVRDWEEHQSSAKHLFIVGDNWKAGGKGRPVGGKPAPDITLDSIRESPYNLKREEGVTVGEFSDNSLTATKLILAEMEKIGAKSFELHVSPYHMVRMYLTILKTAMKYSKQFAIIPVPTPSDMERWVPLSGATPWELVAGEVERIKKYQDKGDVATFPELREYLFWLWRQPLLESHRNRAY